MTNTIGQVLAALRLALGGTKPGCSCKNKTPDGRKIDRRGIPEGGKPKDSPFRWDQVSYIDEKGDERFRYNQGCPLAPGHRRVDR